MKQNDFIAKHRAFWDRMEAMLHSGRTRALTKQERRSFPADYRQICHHLSQAKLRNYSPALQNRLNRMALDGHQKFYSGRSQFLGNAGRFFAVDFPRCVRAHKYYVLVAGLFFFVPLFGLLFGIIKDPGLAYSVIDPQMAESWKQSYEPSEHKTARDSQSDLMMFGYYIWNNVSLALETFASGLILGLGAIFVLLFNGVYIGAVAGLLTTAGYTDTFWPFVAGHGSFELTAIVFAGASGMKLGFSILMPGNVSRIQALKRSADELIPMIYGFVIMLVIAASIEAFWSPNKSIPIITKYWVGGILWALVIGYFLLAGRRRRRDKP